MSWARTAVFAVFFTAACVEEPSYEGRACSDQAPCPEGYRCGADQLCTHGEDSPRDASVNADASFDASAQPDAEVAPDVPTPVPTGPHARTLSGAGRMSAGSKTLDVEIGHPVSQQSTSSGSVELKGTLVPR